MRLDVRLVNAAAIQASVMGHLQEHMKYLAGNQLDSTAATAGQQPGQPQRAIRGAGTLAGADAAWPGWTDGADCSTGQRHGYAAATVTCSNAAGMNDRDQVPRCGRRLAQASSTTGPTRASAVLSGLFRVLRVTRQWV